MIRYIYKVSNFIFFFFFFSACNMALCCGRDRLHRQDKNWQVLLRSDCHHMSYWISYGSPADHRGKTKCLTWKYSTRRGFELGSPTSETRELTPMVSIRSKNYERSNSRMCESLVFVLITHVMSEYTYSTFYPHFKNTTLWTGLELVKFQSFGYCTNEKRESCLKFMISDHEFPGPIEK